MCVCCVCDRTRAPDTVGRKKCLITVDAVVRTYAVVDGLFFFQRLIN